MYAPLLSEEVSKHKKGSLKILILAITVRLSYCNDSKTYLNLEIMMGGYLQVKAYLEFS